MNVLPLQELGTRWPNDQIQVNFNGSLEVLQSLAQSHTHSEQNPYESQLALDPTDSKSVANFAAANALTYTSRSSYDLSSYGEHLPAWYGPRISTDIPIVVHEVKGQLFGFSASFNVEYVPSSIQKQNESQLELKKRSIIRITLPKVFPQIVLDSNKNDRGIVGSIPTSIDPSQKVALEGDFANYYDLYIPIGLQDSALTLLAPNFMQMLKDSSTAFDVEFYGSEMILTTSEPIFTIGAMNEALSILKVQLDYISQLINTWQYQPQTLPFDVLSYSRFNGEIIKIGPVRLQPRAVIIIIIIGFILFGLLIINLNGGSK